MRKLIFAFGLTSALVFALAVQAAAPNFAGTWTLDKSKSQGLNPRWQNAESVTWNVTQTDKEITIDEKVTGGGGPGGPGAGAAPAGPPRGWCARRWCSPGRWPRWRRWSWWNDGWSSNLQPRRQ